MTDTPPTPPPAAPSSLSAESQVAASKKKSHWGMTIIKVVIAVVGIWFVSRLIHWNDSAVIPAGTTIKAVTFAEETEVRALGVVQEGAKTRIRIRFSEKPVKLKVETAEGEKNVEMVVRDGETIPGTHEPLVEMQELEVRPDQLKAEREAPGGAVLAPGQDRVRQGIKSLLIAASGRWYLLVGAWAILCVPFLVTAVRWRNLMRPQGIDMPLSKCLQLTFVGQFYSILLPGITGGDLVKIVYAARLTGSKTKSIVTILLDRVIGLTALITIGGIAATWQLWANRHAGAGGTAAMGDATLKNVLLLIVGIIVGMIVFSTMYFSRRLRKVTGMQRVIDHPKMPGFVKHADEVLHTYRGHFGLLGWAFAISLMSQLALPVSAWLAGQAFGVSMGLPYYLSYVPVAILAVSLPTLPQGVGVLDGIIVHFFANRGTATPSQAFAIAQAIRFLPIMWNLVGAYWVVTGQYSRHKAVEEEKAMKEE